MTKRLIHPLIGSCLADPTSNWAITARQQIESATESEWQQSLTSLGLHRLSAQVFYSLENHGLTDAVPEPYLATMQQSYRQTLTQNKVFFLTLDRILRAMAQRNLHPVVWKGIALADSFYPDPGTRPMGDLDFSIPASEMEEATAAFESIGFLPLPDEETEEAVYFANKMGVVCDVHHRVRLFEGKESMNLSIDLKPQHLKSPALPILEPNAMLVHLIVHMNGHLGETGPLLCWIFDVAFVLRKWGGLLDRDRLEKLMPTKKDFVSLYRILRFLETEFDEKPPECFAKAAKNFEPFTLEEILRQRRLTMWHLSRFDGYLRLLASRLGIKLKNSYPELEPQDLWLWIGDAVMDMRMKNRSISP